ncbi:cathepsin B-like [Cylas formicarius]|uniref:cathepsin B-like n=1 Tax=Cylas formicarius TaxID=197179 RepID=UPI002958CAC4|nr:cathepsin B-like [Cylas formicarius]
MYRRCALLLSVTIYVSGNYHPLSEEYIANINRKQSTWTAGVNFDLSDWDRVKNLASSVRHIPHSILVKYKRNLKDDDPNATIPEYFDSSEVWPGCETIGQIRDQSSCNAGWAFAAVETMSDRICIFSNQTKQVYVSAQDLTTCCTECGDCQGGFAILAWTYWEDSGIVTGGLYNRTDQGCKSYFLPECDQYSENCTDYVATPSCSKNCDDAGVNYEDSLTFGTDIYYLESARQVQLEMLQKGPVEAQFTVYEDFVSYRSGIYQPTTENAIGSHAAKIVGWGVEDGVKFWKVANSWNRNWGENGYFRIIRGVNSCGIESAVLCASPV